MRILNSSNHLHSQLNATRHSIRNFPYFRHEDETGRSFDQAMFRFKPLSILGHMAWLRVVKPEEYQRRMDNLAHETGDY